MGLNPLNKPKWDKRAPLKIRSPDWSSGNTPSAPPQDRRRLSAREWVELEPSEKKIKVEVRGFSEKSGVYNVPFVENASLTHYLRPLNLVRLASKNAVYDTSHYDEGRCGLRYVVQEDSNILIAPLPYGPFTKLQRPPPGVDVDKVIAGMHMEEYPMHYGPVVETTNEDDLDVVSI